MSYERNPAGKPTGEALFEKHTAELLADQLQRLKNAYDFFKQTESGSGLESENMGIRGIYTLDERGDTVQLPEKFLHARIFSGESGTTYMFASLYSKPSEEGNKAGSQENQTPDFKETAFQIVLTNSGRVREFHNVTDNPKYNWYDILSATSQRLEDEGDKRLREFGGQ